MKAQVVLLFITLVCPIAFCSWQSHLTRGTLSRFDERLVAANTVGIKSHYSNIKDKLVLANQAGEQRIVIDPRISMRSVRGPTVMPHGPGFPPFHAIVQKSGASSNDPTALAYTTVAVELNGSPTIQFTRPNGSKFFSSGALVGSSFVAEMMAGATGAGPIPDFWEADFDISGNIVELKVYPNGNQNSVRVPLADSSTAFSVVPEKAEFALAQYATSTPSSNINIFSYSIPLSTALETQYSFTDPTVRVRYLSSIDDTFSFAIDDAGILYVTNDATMSQISDPNFQVKYARFISSTTSTSSSTYFLASLEVEFPFGPETPRTHVVVYGITYSAGIMTSTSSYIRVTDPADITDFTVTLTETAPGFINAVASILYRSLNPCCDTCNISRFPISKGDELECFRDYQAKQKEYRECLKIKCKETKCVNHLPEVKEVEFIQKEDSGDDYNSGYYKDSHSDEETDDGNEGKCSCKKLCKLKYKPCCTSVILPIYIDIYML